jgi:hypothetical protein
MTNVFNRVNRPTTFADIPVGGFFRLDQGGGKGSYFLRTQNGPIWIWDSHTRQNTIAGSTCHMPEDAAVTPASFKALPDE